MNDFDEKKVNEEMLDAETSVEEELKEASVEEELKEASVEEELKEASAEEELKEASAEEELKEASAEEEPEEDSKEDFSAERTDDTVRDDQRIYPADRDRLRKFTAQCKKEGGRAYLVHKMLDLYELNELPGRAEEDERVKAALDFAWKAYKNSVAMYKRLDTDVHIELSERYNTELQEKENTIVGRDKTIGELKEQNAMLKTAKEDAEKELRDITQKAESLAKDLEDARNSAAEKDRISSRLDSMLTEAKAKLDSYDELKKSTDELSAEVKILKIQHENDKSSLKHINDVHEKCLADARATAEQYKKLESANRELEEKLKDAERNLNDCKKAAESGLKNANAEAELAKERAVIAKEREMHDKIRELDRENARLTAKLEQLQTELEQLKSVRKEYGETDET